MFWTFHFHSRTRTRPSKFLPRLLFSTQGAIDPHWFLPRPLAVGASFLDRFDAVLVIISLRYGGWDLDGGSLELSVICAQKWFAVWVSKRTKSVTHPTTYSLFLFLNDYLRFHMLNLALLWNVSVCQCNCALVFMCEQRFAWSGAIQ